MKITGEIRKLFESNITQCTDEACRKESEAEMKLLLKAISSDKVVDFQYMGETKLNSFSSWTRSVYDMSHENGSYFRFAFTGMSTVQVFSKGKRSYHRYSNDLKIKLDKFIKS